LSLASVIIEIERNLLILQLFEEAILTAEVFYHQMGPEVGNNCG
jgi:hypothetical protein